MRKLAFDAALLPNGLTDAVTIEVGEDGLIARISTGASAAAGAERIAGTALPGMSNLHSHAHQRAMAGLAERSGAGEDSFWTWRQAMYRCVERIGPEDLQGIAAQLYVEMLKAGFTAVAEFHYLHNDPKGRRYADQALMSRSILQAADESGIALTLLPVLYAAGGFGGAPLHESQRRFASDPDFILGLLAELGGNTQTRFGVAPHSLRAAPPEPLRALLQGLATIDAGAPIHIHIAEQTKEVEDCLAWCGQRPVAWLFQNYAVDARWCLVHATHMDAGETAALAASGAVAGICPTTEANLGDGFFNAADYLKRQGRFGIGSDSHISVSPIEELRWFEYGQRLLHRRRTLLGGGAHRSTGRALYEAAQAGGAQACGRQAGALAVGCRADLIVLDTGLPSLVSRRGEDLLDAFIFAGNVNPVRDVMVAGKWLVREGRHRREDEIAGRFASILKRLSEG